MHTSTKYRSTAQIFVDSFEKVLKKWLEWWKILNKLLAGWNHCHFFKFVMFWTYTHRDVLSIHKNFRPFSRRIFKKMDQNENKKPPLNCKRNVTNKAPANMPVVFRTRVPLLCFIEYSILHLSSSRSTSQFSADRRLSRTRKPLNGETFMRIIW